MPEKLLNVQEVAEILGYTVQGVYQLCFKRQLKCVSLSRRALRFRVEDIREFINSHIREPIAPPQKDKRTPGKKKVTISDGYIHSMVTAAQRACKR